MSTALATAVQNTDAEIFRVLESSVYPGAKRESISMALSYCRAQGLDPMLKPVHIVPMSVKVSGTRDQYEQRDVIMPGVGLYRIQANRTGDFAGIDEGVFGPDITAKIGTAQITYPEWCSVTVYRIVRGIRVGFSSGRVYWLETYATKSRNDPTPNSMWAKRTRGQIEKCAEALALRRAFPELGAVPTAEEMTGRVIDGGEALAIEDKKIQQPRSKPVLPEPPPPPPSEPVSEPDIDISCEVDVDSLASPLDPAGQRCIVKKVTTKTGSSPRGDWTKYGVCVDFDGGESGVWLNTFNHDIGTFAQQAEKTKTPCVVTFEDGPKGKNLLTIMFAE